MTSFNVNTAGDRAITFEQFLKATQIEQLNNGYHRSPDPESDRASHIAHNVVDVVEPVLHVLEPLFAVCVRDDTAVVS